MLYCVEQSADLYGQALNYVEKSVELVDTNVELCGGKKAVNFVGESVETCGQKC